MKRKKKILMIFGVLLVFACRASANSVGISSVEVIPSQPLNTDLITFSIAGGAVCGGSYVAYDVFSQNGTSLQLDLYVNMGITTEISYWTHSKQIQPLIPAMYSLEVRAFDDKLGSPFYGTVQDTKNVSFSVTPEPSTLAIFGFALPFFRMVSRKKSKVG